ncbi:MAG: DUF5715 family protein [Prevotellaceae bacterium]|nr:DUF5715 family protein [Prevotella sp.]MDD7257252.1 DUF5715 family protein [Prevotellaceae bacterium]MDY6130330.1 DUF5715 family protein [Prevotella sp.]
MKITKNRYLLFFSAIVVILAAVRLFCPQVAENRFYGGAVSMGVPLQDCARHAVQTLGSDKKNDMSGMHSEQNAPTGLSKFFDKEGNPVKHRIFSVPNFSRAFPDSQQVQVVAAQRWGVSPVKDRRDAESRKTELVYVAANPYYYVEKMYRSIPYLVPRAAVLLNDIGRALLDSLQLKGVPAHQLIVTSVLRTQEDVAKLRNYNRNATENSCHLYGTTFDICYNRYRTVEAPGEKRRAVRNDTLKWILSEVLNDMRKQERCYVKYEVKQGCFHITVR